MNTDLMGMLLNFSDVTFILTVPSFFEYSEIPQFFWLRTKKLYLNSVVLG